MKFLNSVLRKIKRPFSDKHNHLVWKCFDKDNPHKFNGELQEIRDWSTSSTIREYVSSKWSLDQLFGYYILNNKYDNTYFCYDDNRLIGLVYLSSPQNEMQDIRIEYLIVNPESQNKGYATRMINSITHNCNYFVGEDCGRVMASVEEKNLPSRKAFLKNNFIVVAKNESVYGRTFFAYCYYKDPKQCKELLDEESE